MSSNGTTLIDIATIAQWGPAKHVNTRLGPRNVRKAPIPENFRALWAQNKDALRAAGMTLGRGPKRTGARLCRDLLVDSGQRRSGRSQRVRPLKCTTLKLTRPGGAK